MLLHTMPLRTFTNTAIRGKIHFCCHIQFLIGCLVFHTVSAIFSHVTEGYIYYGWYTSILCHEHNLCKNYI